MQFPFERRSRAKRVPRSVVEEVVEEAREAGTVLTQKGVTRRPPRPRRRLPPPSRLRYLTRHPEISIRVREELKFELASQARSRGLSLSRHVIDRLTRAVDERREGVGEGYARGRREGEASGYTRGWLDSAERNFAKGKSAGDAAGYARGVHASKLQARVEGGIAGLVAALLAVRAGRDADRALVAFGEQLRGSPELAGQVREIVAQMGLAREFDLFVRHGRYIDPRLADLAEGLSRLSGSG